MPTVHLEPDDVPAFEAGRVLAALNAAPDADFLASAIEFPDELDIGVRLGQRLLDRRDERGGFSTLAQVADVPLIGPERFTEIVVALSGRPALDFLHVPGPVDVATGANPGRADGRVGLGLRVLTTGPWLGQLTTVVATTSVEGQRRPGVEVVLAAGSGRLRAVSGGRVLAGTTVTLVTSADGVARATWLPGTSPPLPPAAAAALGDALGELPTAGATPAAIPAAMEGLVAAYRWEPNEQLRRAVDALADGGVVAPDDVDLDTPWPRSETTITAWALSGGASPDGAADAVAVQPLVARDWRGAFVRVLRDVVAGQSRLASHLLTDQREAADTVDLVGRVQDRVGAFLDVQLGRLGTDIARTVAADSSRAFVVDSTQGLRLDEALQVAPAIAATAATAQASSSAVVRALTQTRSTVLHQVNQRVGSELPPIRTRLDDLTGTVDAKLDRAELDDLLSDTVTPEQLSAAVADKVDRSQLDEAVAGTVGRDELEQALTEKVDRSQLDEAVAGTVGRDELKQALTEKVDRGELDDVLSGVVHRDEVQELLGSRVSLDEFRAYVEETDARIRRLEG